MSPDQHKWEGTLESIADHYSINTDSDTKCYRMALELLKEQLEDIAPRYGVELIEVSHGVCGATFSHLLMMTFGWSNSRASFTSQLTNGDIRATVRSMMQEVFTS